MSSKLPEIKLRTTAEFKARWKAFCGAKGMNGNEAGQRALYRYMGEKDSPKPVRLVAIAESPDKSRQRQEFRLAKSEIQAIDSHAKTCGFSRRNFLVSLIRSYLLKSPQLGMVELAVVGESNKQLAAIRSLLNQIAKKLNSGESVEASTIARAVAGSQKAINAHLAHVHQVMRSNLDRWAIVEASNDDDR